VIAVTKHVFSRIQDVPPAPAVVTIGAFDGVHRGHQHILQLARSRADGLGARLLVLTFEPLPLQLFRPDVFPGRILTTRRRREQLWKYGGDDIVELQFTREMAQITAGEFMDMLMAVGPLREIWIGHDFALGHNREGTPERLQELTREHGTVVHVVDRIDLDGRPVSSTQIRRLILEGNVEEAASLMGHRFQVSGIVEHGAKLGRQIGFPTANVSPRSDLVALKDGIYATLAGIGDEPVTRPAMTYIGKRPALNTGARKIETFLLDFDRDLYGQELVTEFVAHMRDDQTFPGLDELRRQLAIDETMARDILRTVVPGVR
jgi:riboflavin kinase/FMN adenylyltransferase